MKKVLLGLFIFCSCSYSFSQTFTLSPDTVEGTYADYEFAFDYIYVNNNSGGPLTFSFTLLSNTCVTTGWYNTLCTSYTCYPGVPSSGTLGTVHDGNQGYFAYQCGFDGISGDGMMRIRVYETGNPSNADTLTYIYHAYSTAGLSNTTSGMGITVYPNPVTEVLNFKTEDILESGYIQIADMSGKVVMQQLFLSDMILVQVSQLQSGVYFASVFSNNQKVYSTKFLKQ